MEALALAAVLAVIATIGIGGWWWFGFRRRKTILVKEKARELVDASYYVAQTIIESDVAWHHRLIDEHGDSWNVSPAAYQQAEVGQLLTLRQWMDEWRPESEKIRSIGKFLEAVERVIEQGR